MYSKILNSLFKDIDQAESQEWMALETLYRLLPLISILIGFGSGGLLLAAYLFTNQTSNLSMLSLTASTLTLYSVTITPFFYKHFKHKQLLLGVHYNFSILALLIGAFIGYIPLAFQDSLKSADSINNLFSGIFIIYCVVLILLIPSYKNYILVSIPAFIFLSIFILLSPVQGNIPKSFAIIIVSSFFVISSLLNKFLNKLFLTYLENSILLKETLKNFTDMYEKEKIISNFCETSQYKKNQTDLNNYLINFIKQQSEADAIALYILSDQHLHLIARHTTLESIHFKELFALGEGFIGQAFIDKEIKHIISDEAKILTSITSFPISHISIIPAVSHHKCYAVCEIANTQSFSEEKIKTLKSCLDYYASLLSSILHNEELERALNSSKDKEITLLKKQAEMETLNAELDTTADELRKSEQTLQAQQEELRVINEELELQTRALENHRNELINKNKELEKSQKILEEKNKAIELSSKYKSEFLSTMSHELRTPLNSILILSDLLSNNKKGNLTDKQVEHTKVIHSAGSDLLTLINDILDIAKVEEGKVQLVIEEISIQDIKNHLARTFEAIALQKGVQFIINIDPTVPSHLFTDKQRVEQIMRNLLSNAFKFTEQGSVTVKIHLPATDTAFSYLKNNQEPVIALSVIDTGIGIDPDKHALIFEAFQQADGTTSRKYGGTGLGLTISREFAILLEGEVQLQSQGMGYGSIFTLYLPIKNSQAKPPIIHEHKPASIASISNNANRRVLIIEDDDNFSQVVASIAQEFDFPSDRVSSGSDALNYLDQHIPSAIILDLGLPDIDGLELLQKIKHNPRTAEIKVHCISGRDDANNALNFGALAVHKKPATLNQIQQLFNQLNISSQSRLLVIEDNNIQTMAITALFSQHNVLVDTCITGAVAIEHITKNNYECIILDLSLPDIDGHDLLNQISEKTNSSTPIIIYTSRELSREEEFILRKQANRIILKTDKSSERLLAEVSLFLHWIDDGLNTGLKPNNTQNIISSHRDEVFLDKKILVVDDDIRNIYAMSAVLSDLGCDIIIAHNGLESLARLNENSSINLVLMDIMMPEMDGYEAMIRIRAQEKYKNLPIIALTAKAMKEDRSKCIEAGANDYLSKPIEDNKLIGLLRLWLTKHNSGNHWNI
jgi:CheY-like chemotaxis protein